MDIKWKPQIVLFHVNSNKETRFLNFLFKITFWGYINEMATSTVLNLRSQPKSGPRWVCRRVARVFYEELDFEKEK